MLKDRMSRMSPYIKPPLFHTQFSARDYDIHECIVWIGLLVLPVVVVSSSRMPWRISNKRHPCAKPSYPARGVPLRTWRISWPVPARRSSKVSWVPRKRVPSHNSSRTSCHSTRASCECLFSLWPSYLRFCYHCVKGGNSCDPAVSHHTSESLWIVFKGSSLKINNLL